MKNNKLFYGLLLIAGMIMFTACGGDSDGGVTVSEAPSPTIKDKNGKKVVVTEVSNSYGNFYTYNYRKNGKLESIEFYGEEDIIFTVDKDKFIIKGNINWGENDKAEVVLKASLTSLGFISALECTEKGGYEGYDGNYEKYEGKYELNFDYDSNGHLTKITGEVEGMYSGMEYGEKYRCDIDGKYNCDIKWSNGKMMSYNRNASSKEEMGGEKNNYKNGTDADIEYHKIKNTSKQYSYHMSQALFGDILGDYHILEALAVAGLFGKGPDYLPKQISEYCFEEDDFEGNDEWNNKWVLSFDQNSNGTINYEQNGNSSYNRVYFGYDNAASKAKATRSVSENKKPEKKLRPLNSFSKRHRKTQK